MRAVLRAALLLAAAPTVVVAAGTIATDRPDFVESSNTVGAGVFQIETSVARDEADDASGDVRTWSTPTLLRFGFAADWEARLETGGYVRQEFAGVTDDGVADTAVGVKWHTHDGEDGTARPSVGWLLHADLDSGSSRFRGDGIRPSLRGVAEWTFSRHGVGVMAGAVHERNPATRERFTSGLFGLVWGVSATERLRAFVEYSAPVIASSEDGGSEQYVTTGGAYLLGDDWQLDAALRFGLDSASSDFSATAGVSARFGAR